MNRDGPALGRDALRRAAVRAARAAVRAARGAVRAARGLVAIAALGVTLLPAGCGGQVAPDLFEVIRSAAGPGAGAHAALDLVVADDGTARCDRGPRRRMPDALVIQARTIQEAIDPDVLHGLRLPEPGGGVYAYVVRDQDGTARFSDTSPALPAELGRLEGFTLAVAQTVCRLP